MEDDGDNNNKNDPITPGIFNFYQNDPLTAIGYSAKPGDLYYINPPKELNTYPMYIDTPKKMEKTVVGSYISYTMEGTDITEPLTRRYSDFYSLYEKLLQRWPGVYIPRIPPKKITGNLDPSIIKIRMRLLNRFCLNISNIGYLYKSEETTIFRSNVADVSNALNKLPELNYSDILTRIKEAFPEYNENYDILTGKGKLLEFDNFLKKNQKHLEDFYTRINTAYETKEFEQKKYLELIHNFSNYEKDNITSYADDNESFLIFYNPSYSTLSEKVLKLKQEMINPYIAFKDWIEEEILDVEAMQLAIKQIMQLIETEDKLKEKLNQIEEDIKNGGKGNFLIGLFKKKEDIMSNLEKEKELTQQKINDIEVLIKIIGDNMENKIENFKKEKTQNYYKSLKLFAILQRESKKVVKELWTIVKNALNSISPNAGKDEEFKVQPMNEQKENQDDVPEE